MRQSYHPAYEPTVHVVDDDAAVRKSLALLMASAGLHAKTYASAEEFLEQYDPHRPGCLILDIRMPGISGLRLQEILAARHDAIPVIFLTGHGDISMAVQAMQSGAVDFIEKPLHNGHLLEVTQRSLQFDAQRRREQARRSDILERLERLTPREREIMEYVVQGKLNKVIAAELGISTRTVEIHRARIMEKLGVRSPCEIVGMVLAAEPSKATETESLND
jgi:FixJ family two-component response regulator